jgi:hypothetical protein
MFNVKFCYADSTFLVLALLIDELAKPQQGKLEPFAPVVVNILKSWLQS